MAKSRIDLAREEIETYFRDSQKLVFKQAELATILSEERSGWGLAKTMSAPRFAKFLHDEKILQRYDLKFPYRAELRFARPGTSLLQVLLSLKSGAYFTHHTAAFTHALTEHVPPTIYLNYEQRPHVRNVQLQQSSIDTAFKRQPRESSNAIEFANKTIRMVNGMHTNRLEVINMPFAYDTDSSVPIDVTSLERTLLDITVRPVYAGGVEEVLKAFIRAKGRADIQSLVEILRKLDYVYPYHQAVGYYLERAGYCPEEIELVSAIPMEHDFYLTHYTGETVYVKHWRLHVPVTFPGL